MCLVNMVGFNWNIYIYFNYWYVSIYCYYPILFFLFFFPCVYIFFIILLFFAFFLINVLCPIIWLKVILCSFSYYYINFNAHTLYFLSLKVTIFLTFLINIRILETYYSNFSLQLIFIIIKYFSSISHILF